MKNIKADNYNKLSACFNLSILYLNYFLYFIYYNITGSIKRACEKKSVNSVFYDYIFTYPAL